MVKMKGFWSHFDLSELGKTQLAFKKLGYKSKVKGGTVFVEQKFFKKMGKKMLSPDELMRKAGIIK